MYSVGSLFSGCGNFDLGFELAGFETKWFSEIDKWCNKILEKNFPGIPNLGDVNEIEPEPVDILIGGFPCQPVSQAGVKRAEQDERWLWPGFYKTICLLRPRIVVVENVPGLRKRGFDRVLGDLAEGGYNAEWFSLRSSDIGAPHRRERVFIVAYTPVRWEHETNEDNQFIQLSSSEDFITSNSNEERSHWLMESRTRGGTELTVCPTSDTSGSGTGRNSGTILREKEQRWMQEDGINTSISHPSITLNSTDEQSNRLSWNSPTDSYHRRFQIVGQQESKPKSKPGDESDRFASKEQPWGKYLGAIERWESIFEPPPPPRTVGERLSPNFVEWMMGLPQNWTEGVSRSQRLKMLGNSVQVQCSYEVARIVKSLADFDGAG